MKWTAEEYIVSNNIQVSVVIPAYNRQGTIVRCINSVLGQVLRPFELIIVDDGSDDGTVSAIKELISTSQVPMTLLLQNHLGAQAARNNGIKNAKGNWIAFLDSDDTWDEEYLKTMIQPLVSTRREDIVVCCDGDVYDENGFAENLNLPGVSGYIYADLLATSWPMFQGMLVSRKALDQIGYLDENCIAYQEWETAIRLAQKNEFVFLDKPLFHYYRNLEINCMSLRKNKGSLARIYLIKKYKKDIMKFCSRRTLAEHYWNAAANYDGIRKMYFLCLMHKENILAHCHQLHNKRVRE